MMNCRVASTRKQTTQRWWPGHNRASPPIPTQQALRHHSWQLSIRETYIDRRAERDTPSGDSVPGETSLVKVESRTWIIHLPKLLFSRELSHTRCSSRIRPMVGDGCTKDKTRDNYLYHHHNASIHYTYTRIHLIYVQYTYVTYIHTCMCYIPVKPKCVRPSLARNRLLNTAVLKQSLEAHVIIIKCLKRVHIILLPATNLMGILF